MENSKIKEVVQYIGALGRLYGVVHKDVVKKVYNQQNEQKIDNLLLEKIMNEENLWQYFIYIEDKYFCYDAIVESEEEFKQYIAHQKTLPFYVPEKEELLRYTDDWYFENNKATENLLEYLSVHFFKGKKAKAKELVVEILISCEDGLDIWWIEHCFNVFRFDLQKREDKEKVMDLIKELVNQTRRPMFNGYKGNELFNRTGEKKYLC